MIKSDAQLERAKNIMNGFKQVIEEIKTTQNHLSEEVLEAVINSHQGMISKLQFEVDEYESAKQGIIRLPYLSSPRELGIHLVKFRIALGISQEQLAGMLGVSRQTVNKHEEQEYQLASVDLMTRVSECLGLLPEIRIKHKTLDIKQPISAA